MSAILGGKPWRRRLKAWSQPARCPCAGFALAYGASGRGCRWILRPIVEDRTRALAEWVAGLSAADLSSEADRAQLDKLILDHLGVCYRGAFLPWGDALQRYAQPYAGTGSAVVFGSQLKVIPAVAALVNATCAHGLEHDDTHDEGMSHPGAIVIAVALAIASEKGLSGPRDPRGHRGGVRSDGAGQAWRADRTSCITAFHPTALFGGFGAATDRGQAVRAAGAIDCRDLGPDVVDGRGAQCSSRKIPHGTVVKRLHGGYGAHNGTMAAQLAALGIAGPSQAFDGTYGLVQPVFRRTPDLERLTRPVGRAVRDPPDQLQALPVMPALFHSTIDALREVTDGFSAANDDIEKIVVGGPAVYSKANT